MKEKVLKILYILVLAIIFIIAATARLKGYLSIRSIWHDEAEVFINIISSVSPFSVLHNIQVMPPFFLLIERFFYNLWGVHELVLRFYPFICSLVAIPLFYYFSKIFLEKKWSIAIANFLFAINIFLIYYAQELKQYSSDVMWFMIIFMLLNRISIKDINKKNIIIYIAATSLIPLFSTPTYFVVGAWVIRELLSCRKALKIIPLALLQLPATIITVLYFDSMWQQHNNHITYCSYYWNNGFLTNDLHFDFQILKNGIDYFFKPNINYGLEIALILAGLIILIRHFKLKENILLFFTICFMLIFSYLRIYPLLGRVMLYAAPILIILASKPLDYITIKKKFLSIIIAILFLFAFNGYGIKHIKNCYTEYATKIRFEDEIFIDVKELVSTLISKYKPTDLIIINFSSKFEYIYYKKYFKFKPNLQNEHLLYNYSCQKRIPAGEKCWLIFIREYMKENDTTDSDFLEYCKKFKVISRRKFNTGYLIYAEKE